MSTLNANELEIVLNKISMTLESCGIPRFYIIGGSARSVLESSRSGGPISFRDFDIAVIKEDQVSEAYVLDLSLKLAECFEVKFDPSTIGRRQREKETGEGAVSFNAGYGSFIITSYGMLDLSVFHRKEDFIHNGLMSWDRVHIPVEIDFDFNSLIVIDPDEGLNALLMRRFKISSLASFQKKPHIMALRLMKDSIKKDFPIPVAVELRLKEVFEKALPPVNIGFLVHDLEKLTSDPRTPKILRKLSRMSFFSGWADEFSSYVYTDSFSDLVSAPKAQKYEKLWEMVFACMPVRKRNWIIKGIGESDPKNFIENSAKYLEGQNVAYFTGDFGPFHDGHKSVLQTVLRKTDLDLILTLVIPRPRVGALTEHFDPAEWLERTRFTQAALDRVGRSVNLEWGQIIPEPASPQTLIDFVDQSFAGEGKLLTQVAGADSLVRLHEFGYMKRYPRKRIIVTRPGIQLTSGQQEGVKVLENLLTTPVSSTFLTHALAAGRSVPQIDPLVKDLMDSYPRYSAELARLSQLGKIINEFQARKSFTERDVFVIDPLIVSGDTDLHSKTMIEELVRGLGDRKVYFIGDEVPEIRRVYLFHRGNSLYKLEEFERILRCPFHKISFYGEGALSPLLNEELFISPATSEPFGAFLQRIYNEYSLAAPLDRVLSSLLRIHLPGFQSK